LNRNRVAVAAIYQHKSSTVAIDGLGVLSFRLLAINRRYSCRESAFMGRWLASLVVRDSLRKQAQAAALAAAQLANYRHLAHR
jgi:hypothetical protein